MDSSIDYVVGLYKTRIQKPIWQNIKWTKINIARINFASDV